MDAARKGRLEAYLRNSTRFLWGLGAGNQKQTYRWLRSRGFDFRDGSYSYVTQQLLENPGIERLLREIVVPEVGKRFTSTAMNFLRTCWRAGTRPDMTFLTQYDITGPQPLLEVNTQYNYVERWGELTGVWFEEIERVKELGSGEPTE